MAGNPFGPWRSARTADELTEAGSRPLSGHWYDEFAVIYDEAFDRGGITPPEVDALTVLDVAAMLGRNRSVPREEWPEDGPGMLTIRSSLARSEGREVPDRDTPIGDDEYARMLALVRSAQRVVG